MSPPDATSNDYGRHKPRSPRILIGLLLFVMAVGLLVLWSNHHGQSAWEKYKSEMEARGEKMDWQAWLPPPPPPDEENFAATLLLKAVGVRGKTDPTVEGRFNRLSVNRALGYTGDFEKGEHTDLVAVQKLLREQTNREPSLPPLPQAPTADVLAAFKPVEAELNELRAAATRPYARIKLNLGDPMSMETPNFVALRELAQTFNLKAIAELRLGQVDDAFSDARVLFRLADAGASSPTLVSAMICVAVDGLAIQPFWEGWEAGQWSDQQLEKFEGLLAQVDLLSIYDTAMRGGERARINSMTENLSRQQLSRAVVGSAPWSGGGDWRSRLVDFGIRVGLAQKNQLTFNRLLDETVFPNHDTLALRVYPSRCRTNAAKLDRALSYTTPFNYLARMAIPNTTRALQTVARNQTYINMAWLTCALERYRRVNGRYPDSLAALTPQFANSLPHDLITGQPLKYRRTDDGRFLLYSVGWNEKDDGGLQDEYKGDWVWPARAKE